MQKRLWLLLVGFSGMFLIPTIRLQAQNGSNAVVYSSGGPIAVSPSYDLVDATRFGSGDICNSISTIFGTYNTSNANGIVIDARGVTSLTCTSGDGNPWQPLTTVGGKGPFPNIVLLPAGTINIAAKWVLPDHTQLIGEGPGSTFITAASGLSGDMIDMGAETGFPCSGTSGTPDCPGIVIEHLSLTGNTNVNGIVNCCAQELSRVEDVAISGANVGLWLSDAYAYNSGPYRNLTISGANTCLSIGNNSISLADTRGFHGIYCSVNSGSSAAVLIDGNGNTLEDISISGSATDGLLIGSRAPAQGNTLINIRGNGPTNVIEISNRTQSSKNCPSPTGINTDVCDTTIMGVTRSNGTNTIKDDLIGTSIQDTTLAMYIIGDPVQNSTTSYIGFSRFTTATQTQAPTWLVGTSAPTTSTCAVGSLYSCTGVGTCSSGSTTATLWECQGGGTWVGIQ